MRNYLETDGNRTLGISIEVDVFKEGDYIVAYCRALELSSFGKDEGQARENFEDALNIFIEETNNRGTLEKVLLDLGWSLRKKPTAILHHLNIEERDAYSNNDLKNGYYCLFN